jgi:rhamnogalacturonyl hydrolase YesR
MKPWKMSLGLVAMLSAASAFAQNRHFTDWPAGTSPAEVGKRVAEVFIPTPHMEMNSHGPLALHYSHVATWTGALQFAAVTKDKDLKTRLVDRFDPFLAPAGPRVPRADHVDGTVFGALPLELYMQDARFGYRVMGLGFADAQWDQPLPDGLTRQTRWWIDDMYMITALQLAAYLATGEQKYLERATLAMVAYLARLQQPNGLFFHAPDVPFYWGRGDGWVAVGMTELLRDLPPKHKAHKGILTAYRRMMATLLTHQAENGMWRQLIDHPESWEESSSTAMFTYSFVTGVKNGWLAEETYGPAARKAWIALVGYLTPEGLLREVCVGTGSRARRSRASSGC